MAKVCGPLGARAAPCIHHQNRNCCMGSEGKGCAFWHCTFDEVPRCREDEANKKCKKGHCFGFYHEAECNQGLMRKQKGPIAPYRAKPKGDLRFGMAMSSFLPRPIWQRGWYGRQRDYCLTWDGRIAKGFMVWQHSGGDQGQSSPEGFNGTRESGYNFPNQSSENGGDFDDGEVLGPQDQSTILEGGCIAPSEVDISCSMIVGQGHEEVKIEAGIDGKRIYGKASSEFLGLWWVGSFVRISLFR